MKYKNFKQKHRAIGKLKEYKERNKQETELADGSRITPFVKISLADEKSHSNDEEDKIYRETR